MAALTRELRGTSSTLRLRNFQTNCLTVDLVFRDGRVMTPAEAKFPKWFQSIPLDQRQLGLLKQQAVVIHLLDKNSPLPEPHRTYFLGLSIQTLLVISLNLGTELIGSLVFQFAESREFRPEEIERSAVAGRSRCEFRSENIPEKSLPPSVQHELLRIPQEAIHDAVRDANPTSIDVSLKMGRTEPHSSSKRQWFREF
jgi:hypothetical protein